jgi:hypothetical protein
MSAHSLSALATAVESIPDPRSKQGVTHPYQYAGRPIVIVNIILQQNEKITNY